MPFGQVAGVQFWRTLGLNRLRMVAVVRGTRSVNLCHAVWIAHRWRPSGRAILFWFVIVIGILLPSAAYLFLRGRRLLAPATEVDVNPSHELTVGDVDAGFWEWHVRDGHCVFSPRLHQLLQTAESMVPARWRDFLAHVHADDRGGFVAATAAAAANETPFNVDLRLAVDGVGYRWFMMSGSAFSDAGGRVLKLGGMLADVHERKLAQLQLLDERARTQAIMAAIGDGVITTDAFGRVTFLNSAAESLIGFSLDQCRGKNIRDVCRVVAEGADDVAVNLLDSVLCGGVATRKGGNLLLFTRDGLEIPVSRSAAPIYAQSGAVVGAVLVIRDCSRERQFLSSLGVPESRDALTKSMTRREFNRRLAFVLERALATGRYYAVVNLRLDAYRQVIQICGAAAGDELARQVSAALGAHLRDGDTLARLGEGEFGLLFENCPPEHAFRIASKALDSIKDFPFTWHQRAFSVNVYMGLVNIAEDLFALGELVAAAETACVMAKKKGRNVLHVYQPADGEMPGRQGEAEWIAKIHSAVEENRCRLYVQPVVRLSDPDAPPEYHEITVRLLDLRGKIATAAEFIAATERFGMGPLLDRWVVRTVFLTLAKRREQAPARACGVWAINLSAASVADINFVTFLREQFVHYGIPYSSICFEITEKAITAGAAQAQHFITEFRQQGCKFTLDKFGASVSLFTQLKAVPVNYLKIDGAFIKGLNADPIDLSMVRATISIAWAMGVQVIAEFVETEATISLLNSLGVKLGQGHAIARAQPMDSTSAVAKTRLRVVPNNSG